MSDRPLPEQTRSATLDEEIQFVRLPSGLRVLFCPKPGFKKKYACYSTFYGSVDTEFVDADGHRLRVPDGIAHFLEHTLFETEEGNASDLFAQRGAYSNASTSFTTTTYLFAAADCFLENLDLLIRFVENPVFQPENVEKEKGIIEQEIRGYQDNPQWVSYMGLLENLFAVHPVRIDIAGSVESIRAIDSETLHRCYRTFYHPSNMILFVVGDIDPDTLFEFVARRSRHGPSSTAPAVRSVVEHVYPQEPHAVFRGEVRRSMEVALPKLLLGFKEVSVPMRGEDYVSRELCSELALEIIFGRSSDLFRELYESRLILDDFGVSYGAGAGIGHSIIGGDTPEPDRLRDILLRRISRWLDEGIGAEDFDRKKRAFMGSFIRGFNSLEYIASHYTHFRFHDYDLFESIDLLSRITREMLETRFRELLDPGNHSSFVILPA